MDTKCPQCHKDTIVEGKIYNQADYVDPKAYFRPNGLPFYAFFSTNIWVDNCFLACTYCGHVWAKLDTERLNDVIAKNVIRKSPKSKSGDVYDLGA